MKRFRFIIALLPLLLYISACYPQNNERDVIYQVSTIDALLEGIYDGQTTYKELRNHGDFGIGTFNNLDGEMIALEGTFYQIKVDGIAYEVSDRMQTPFAVVTYFEKDIDKPINDSMNYQQLQQFMDTIVPTDNIFYAIRIDGLFSYIKVRSVPRQERPYLPLVEVTEEQKIFEFKDITGTLVGFRSPPYITGINVPGYHLHFITEDRKAGGHLLECLTQNGEMEIDTTPQFLLILPEDKEFYNVILGEDKQKEVEEVEK